MKTQTMTIREFMSGEYNNRKKRDFRPLQAATAIVTPFILSPLKTSAETIQAVPVGAVTKAAGTNLTEVIAHALDPLVDIMVALSFPVASVVIVGACFFFMFGQGDRAWTMIMNSGLGYVLIQISPLFLKILKDIGAAI